MNFLLCRAATILWLLGNFTLVTAPAVAQGKQTWDTGGAAMSRGDYKTAETFYRSVLQQHPDSAETLSNLGISLQMQGQSTEAIKAFEDALKIRQMPETYALLAEERCKSRDLDGARPMLARIFYEDLQAPEVLAGVAPCYMELDEPVESVLVYQRLTASAAYATDFNFVRLARSSFKASHYFYLRLAKLPGADPYIQAITRAKEQGSPDARGAFETAAKASAFFQPDLTYAEGVQRWHEHPDDAALLYLLSVLSGEQGMAAVEACEQRFPESPYLIEMKAQMLASEWRTKEALTLYEALGKDHPDFPNLLYDLGMVYRDKKEWEKALDAFQRQLKMHPEDEQCAARISEALLQLSRWKDLGKFLSPWIEPSHQSLWAVLDYADASRNLNTPASKVIKVLAAAEQSYPDSQAFHWRLMQLYRAQGDAPQTAKELRLFHALSTTGQMSKSTN